MIIVDRHDTIGIVLVAKPTLSVKRSNVKEPLDISLFFPMFSLHDFSLFFSGFPPLSPDFDIFFLSQRVRGTFPTAGYATGMAMDTQTVERVNTRHVCYVRHCQSRVVSKLSFLK